MPKEAVRIVQLVRITPEPEEAIEFAARTCYRSHNRIAEGTAGDLIQRLIASGHESILEHASATFYITGVSRALTHQFVRHRFLSPSQESQRYTKTQPLEYVKPLFPEEIRREAERVLEYALVEAERAYGCLLDLGVLPEDARAVLPNCAASALTVTANFREWRHIAKLRIHPAAQKEVRGMMREILEILNHHAPSVFGDLMPGGAK